MRYTPGLVTATIGALMYALSVAPASADPQSAQDTISDLRAQGYSVILDRTGTAPLSDCVVTGFRNERVIRQGISVGPQNDHHWGDLSGNNSGAVISKSITVTLDCTAG